MERKGVGFLAILGALSAVIGIASFVTGRSRLSEYIPNSTVYNHPPLNKGVVATAHSAAETLSPDVTGTWRGSYFYDKHQAKGETDKQYDEWAIRQLDPNAFSAKQVPDNSLDHAPGHNNKDENTAYLSISRSKQNNITGLLTMVSGSDRFVTQFKGKYKQDWVGIHETKITFNTKPRTWLLKELRDFKGRYGRGHRHMYLTAYYSPNTDLEIDLDKISDQVQTDF